MISKFYNTYISTKNFRRKTNISFLWYCYVLDLSWNCCVVPTAIRMRTKPTQRICSEQYKQSSHRSRPWSFLLFSRNAFTHFIETEIKRNLVNSHSFHWRNSVPKEPSCVFLLHSFRKSWLWRYWSWDAVTESSLCVGKRVTALIQQSEHYRS